MKFSILKVTHKIKCFRTFCVIFIVKDVELYCMIAIIPERCEKLVSVRVPLKMMENESNTNVRGCLLHKLEK